MVTPLPALGGISEFVRPRRNALLGFASGLVSGNNWGDALGSGFANAMQGRQMDDAYAVSQAEEAERQRQITETAKYLRTQGATEWADRIDAGIVDPQTAFNNWYGETKPKERNLMTVAPGATVIDEATGQPVFTGPPDPKDAVAAEKEGFDRESALWKEYMAAEPVKTYQSLRNSYERIRQSATMNSGPGDLGLIFNYMKMLDPGSVVREGEFATAENAGGVSQQVTNLYNKVLTGERLTPELRQQFVSAADRLYQEASSNVTNLNTQMQTRAEAWGVDPTRIVSAPEVYAPLDLNQTRVIAPGVTIKRIK